MIWRREEYIAHMNFQYTGREMFCELFGLLIGLDDEWRAQGATEDELNLTAFDWDYVLRTNVGMNLKAITNIEPKIIEDDAETQISIDSMGRKMKLCKKSATIPLPLSHPVATMDDWLKIKHWYAFDESRLDVENLQKAKKLREKGYLINGSMLGGFDEPRQLMGEENLCIAFYEEPELIRDILSTIADTTLKLYERVLDVVPIDCISVHEDLAGKSGPLVGPTQIHEFIKPYYRKIWDELSRHGCTIFSQDSDGDVNSVLESFMDCGVTCTYPCEPNANMDIVKIREKYGKKLSLKGGIDKFVLRKTKEDIKNELTYKICPQTLGGGTVFAIDHRIPNGVPLENYRFYVNYARELLGIPPVKDKGFARMAF